MFKKLFKKGKKEEDLSIYAPLSGKIMPLEEVPDPVFGQKMMGEGIAIVPSKGEVLSPVKGKVIQIPDSKHAIGIEAEDGSQILIHVGLETVALKGEGFTVKTKVGASVQVGDPLLDFDLPYIVEHAEHTVTPIVITNSLNSDKNYTPTEEKDAIAGQTAIMTISN